MKRAIVSGHCGGEWADIASVTWPLMQSYAQRHGLEFHGCVYKSHGYRPASWKKLVSIASAMVHADEVLWLDADVVIVDQSLSIFDAIDLGECIQAMCRLSDYSGVEHHNAGVWVLRREMLPFLMTAAMDDSCIHHPWWEQQAIRNLIDHIPTIDLPHEWNVWTGADPSVVPRFRHACGLHGPGQQLEAVKRWAS